MRAYVCFLEREVYAFLSTFDKRGERVRGECCGPAFFCLWEGRKVGGQTVAGRPRSDVREIVGKSSARKGRSGVFLFLGEVLLALSRKRRGIDTAALGCAGGREDGSARESLCVGGFA